MQLEQTCNLTFYLVRIKETLKLYSPKLSRDIVLSVCIAALVNRNQDF